MFIITYTLLYLQLEYAYNILQLLFFINIYNIFVFAVSLLSILI